jgi:hypothetical protein
MFMDISVLPYYSGVVWNVKYDVEGAMKVSDGKDEQSRLLATTIFLCPKWLNIEITSMKESMMSPIDTALLL